MVKPEQQRVRGLQPSGAVARMLCMPRILSPAMLHPQVRELGFGDGGVWRERYVAVSELPPRSSADTGPNDAGRRYITPAFAEQPAAISPAAAMCGYSFFWRAIAVAFDVFVSRGDDVL